MEIQIENGEKRFGEKFLFPFDFLLLDEPFTGLDEENRKKAGRVSFISAEEKVGYICQS